MNSWMTKALVDRAAHLRTAESLRELQQHPQARYVVVDARSRIALQGDQLAWFPITTENSALFFLGLCQGAPLFAQHSKNDESYVSLRECAHRLSQEDLECAMTACALAAWHAQTSFCSLCSGATSPQPGGFSRRCEQCNSEHFPRHDPAMIVAVLDDQDRLLLGNHTSWDQNRYSLLAGFVEAGESVTQAVHREVWEEVGITLSGVHHLADQPWPFPRSLMFAAVARAATTDINPDRAEINDARFFSRSEITQALESGTITIPAASASIAAWVINQWRQEQLPSPDWD
ncbi:MAG: NAD(+) diphosphatase [Propionibacteriaceae bacterium]